MRIACILQYVGWVMIDVGKLNKKIQIQKKSGIRDPYGHEVISWVKVVDCFANVKPIGGREKIRNNAIESTLSCTIAIRYNPDLLPLTTPDSWRIIYESRILNITAAQDLDEARRFIIFDCIETG